MMSLIILTPQRRPSLDLTTSVLSDKTWTSASWFELRARRWIEKERTVQDRKNHIRVTFHLFEDNPQWNDRHQKFGTRDYVEDVNVVDDVLGIITCAKFLDDFTAGRIFHFPIDFWMGLTTVQRYCAACDSTSFRERWNSKRINGLC